MKTTEDRFSASINLMIAVASMLAIVVHLVLRYGFTSSHQHMPLLVALALGGSYLVFELIRKALARDFGSDLLAGISIITAVLLNEYLAGTIVVLMMSGGATLEAYAVRSASSVLLAMSKRMPSVTHRREGTSQF